MGGGEGAECWDLMSSMKKWNSREQRWGKQSKQESDGHYPNPAITKAKARRLETPVYRRTKKTKALQRHAV